MVARLALVLVLALPAAGAAGGPRAEDRLVFTQWTLQRDRFDRPIAYLCSSAADGTDQRRLLEPDRSLGGVDGAAAFSPDGKRVAFVRGGSTEFGALYVADGSGGDAKLLHPSLAHPAWRPDGRRILGDFGADLVEVSWPEGVERGLTATPARAELYPAPSPDGSRLAYVETAFAAVEPRRLVLSDAAGGNPRTLLTAGRIGRVGWAPDGRRLVYANEAGIWEVAAAGGEPRRLRASGAEPAYSPDGARIAFADDGDVWTMDAGGRDVRRVTETPVSESGPAWQPAGAPAPTARRPCAITGTSGDDVLVGTDDADLFLDLGGDDVIRGLGGDDVILDGPGDDVIETGDGNDVVRLTAGRNRLDGGAGNDELGSLLSVVHDPQVVVGGRGDDALVGGQAADRLEGGDGRDAITGLRGPDMIRGGLGDDRLQGNRGDDHLDGGLGDDVIFGGRISGPPRDYDGYDVLLGRGGDDRLAGGWQKDRLFGGAGNDRLRGGPHADHLVGESGRDDVGGETGDDLLLARDGARDAVSGGPGVDRASFDGLDRRAGVERRLRRG